ARQPRGRAECERPGDRRRRRGRVHVALRVDGRCRPRAAVLGRRRPCRRSGRRGARPRGRRRRAAAVRGRGRGADGQHVPLGGGDTVIHHVGYVVEDLPAATQRLARAFGAGPFPTLEHIAFDEVTFAGEPAVYDHSSAFGAWGPILVELTQV